MRYLIVCYAVLYKVRRYIVPVLLFLLPSFNMNLISEKISVDFTVPDECYSRNASCVLSLISTFFIYILVSDRIKKSKILSSQCTLAAQIEHMQDKTPKYGQDEEKNGTKPVND